MGEVLTQEALAFRRTEHVCANCADPIRYTEEVSLLQIIQPEKAGARILYCPLVNGEGHFLFEPFCYCFKCWEELYETVREETRDEPPVLDPKSVFECTCCESGIREGEYAGIFTIGEFHLSRRAPNGIRGPEFMPNGSPDLLCLYCMLLLNMEIEMWEEGVSQCGECAECVQARCWRGVECDCSCHFEEQEYED